MENQEPATPFIVEEEETEQKLIRIIEKNDNKGKYELKFLATNQKLYIQCLDKEFPNPTYENNYSLKKLNNIHRYFQTYENIQEVCSFIESVNKNSINLDKKNENIILKIKCFYKQKLNDIDFELLSVKTDYNKIINDLFSQIYQIKEGFKNIN